MAPMPTPASWTRSRSRSHEPEVASSPGDRIEQPVDAVSREPSHTNSANLATARSRSTLGSDPFEPCSASHLADGRAVRSSSRVPGPVYPARLSADARSVDDLTRSGSTGSWMPALAPSRRVWSRNPTPSFSYSITGIFASHRHQSDGVRRSCAEGGGRMRQLQVNSNRERRSDRYRPATRSRATRTWLARSNASMDEGRAPTTWPTARGSLLARQRSPTPTAVPSGDGLRLGNGASPVSNSARRDRR